MTLADVERAAGVGRSPLYHYFDDRDDLIRSVVHSTVDTVLTAQEPLLLGVGSPAAGLRRIQKAAELRPDADVTELADFTMAAIQGGLLLAPVRRAPDQIRLTLHGGRAALEHALTPQP
ncbi:TetR family transcriptional regulator [Streptomyces griseoluteus]